MEEIVEKLCCFCGADVTHEERHKNRYGDYVCMTCHRSKKHSSRHKSSKEKAAEVRRAAVYIFFAIIGSWLFCKFLDVFAQWGD
jgi:hypothetical protein